MNDCEKVRACLYLELEAWQVEYNDKIKTAWFVQCLAANIRKMREEREKLRNAGQTTGNS